MRLILADGSDSSITGTVTETTIKSFVIPAGVVGANDWLLIWFFPSWTDLNNVVNIYFGSLELQNPIFTQFGSAGVFGWVKAAFFPRGDQNNGFVSEVDADTTVTNETGGNSGANAQGYVENSTVSGSVDLTKPITVKITGVPALLGDTMTIHGLYVFLMTAGV